MESKTTSRGKLCFFLLFLLLIFTSDFYDRKIVGAYIEQARERKGGRERKRLLGHETRQEKREREGDTVRVFETDSEGVSVVKFEVSE